MEKIILNFRSAFAECLGAALLVYFGLGTALLAANVFFTSLVFGLACSVLIYMAQHSYAGQLNPAVSVALAVSGYIRYPQALLNICAQLLGGVIATGLLFASMPRGMAGNVAANKIGEDFDVHQAVVGELIAGFFLQLAVFETMLHPKNKVGALAPLAIGFVVFVAHGVLVPIDGCSLNPARSFGPALLSATWDHFWIFALCPILGALLAIPAHIIFLYEPSTITGNNDLGTKSSLDAQIP